MDQLAVIADARAAIADLANSDNPASRRFGEWLRFQFENAANGAALEPLLALSPGKSQWAVNPREIRDDAIRELAERFHSDKRVAGQARAVERESCRYAASAWRFDRNRADMPSHYVGTAKEFIWRAFKSGAEMPLKKRQLQRILPAAKAKIAA